MRMAGWDAAELADLRSQTGLLRDYPQSFTAVDGAALWLEPVDGEKRLAVLARADGFPMEHFSGSRASLIDSRPLWFCPVDNDSAAALRRLLPWLRPVPLGLTTSAGFGDRLGLATPGQARALLDVLDRAPGRQIAPIFAQQSIREMTRTRRTPLDVLADATWGAFQAGWRAPVGADADHLKTIEDVDRTVAAGYSFFTIDPSPQVDDAAGLASGGVLQAQLDALPWTELESSPADLQRRYGGRVIELDDRAIHIDEESLARAAVKYGRAIQQVRVLYEHLAGRSDRFELEVSVDETETPTTPVEHVYIVAELQRLGVRFVSLAPRYVGRFEKGVDYIGDLAALADDLELHAAIARALGPYKLSLHSGSDKFAVYPLAYQATRGMVHLKTAGTSYLEALRVVAGTDSEFFREILEFARERYGEDRATYHVSAGTERILPAALLADADLPALLDEFNARQVLHVTFGSVLDRFGDRLLRLLRDNESAYGETLERHFVRHLTPFVQPLADPVPAERAP